jgi:hypothetical protein
MKRNKKADVNTGNFRNKKTHVFHSCFAGKHKALPPTIQNILNHPHLFTPAQVQAAARAEFLAR